MKCSEVLGLLDALVDRELPPTEESSVNSHIARCPSCQHELQQKNDLRDKLQRLPRHTVPPSLLGKVENQIAGSSGPPVAASRHRLVLPVLTHFAAVLLGGAILYGYLNLQKEASPSAREIVAAHVRSLMDKQIVQVMSGDTHKVRPWFAGKLDFSPPVRNLEAEGFPLVGGRIDYLGDRKIAALVYQRREHRISLFILPRFDKLAADLAPQSLKGYNIVRRRGSDFTYWAISDLAEKELTDFARLVVEKSERR